MNTKIVVWGLLFHNNKIISVSRKDNHNDFGLFGGKLENDETWKEALIRECYEETGYSINIIPVYYEAMCDDTLVRTYICIATDWDVDYPERDLAVVKYLPPSVLTSGSFGDYSKALFKHFNIDDREK